MVASAQNVSQYQESDVKSPINMLSGYVGNIFDNVSGYQGVTNAQARAAAADYNSWAERQAQITRDFNSAEAAKNRDWQEYMSNTAHRREVRDLQLAGLNPVLSATGGQGAAVGSGATASAQNPSGSKADVDMSLTTSMMGLLGKALDSLTAVETSNNSARSAQAQTDKINATSELTARLGLLGTKYSADKSSDASKYLADINYSIARDFPNNPYAAINSLIGALFGKESGIDTVRDVVDILTGPKTKEEKEKLEKELENTYPYNVYKKYVDSMTPGMG